jgi:hypothetical protein
MVAVTVHIFLSVEEAERYVAMSAYVLSGISDNKLHYVLDLSDLKRLLG